jgi:hypothetical protein
MIGSTIDKGVFDKRERLTEMMGRLEDRILSYFNDNKIINDDSCSDMKRSLILKSLVNVG